MKMITSFELTLSTSPQTTDRSNHMSPSMPHHKKKKRKQGGKTIASLLLAPFAALQDAALHLKDGIVQILVFFGLLGPPHEKDWRSNEPKRRKASPRDTQRALADLTKAESKRNQKEVAIKLREERLLNSKTPEAKEFHEDMRRSIRSVSKGNSVSHLSNMQRKAREAKAAEEANAAQQAIAREADIDQEASKQESLSPTASDVSIT